MSSKPNNSGQDPATHDPKRSIDPTWRTYLPAISCAVVATTITLVSIVSTSGAAHVIIHSSHGTALHSFGTTTPLLLARYTNFLLDMLARCVVLVSGLLLNYVCIQFATTQSFSATGILARDGVSFYKADIRFMSLWDCIQLRVPRVLRIWLLICLVSGLGANIASRLIFGYQTVRVSEHSNEDVQLWDSTAPLGSNFSGQFIAPDYRALLSKELSPHFSQLVAKTLALADTLPSNTPLNPEFNTIADSVETLLLRNISQVLQTETVTTTLINCRPITQEDRAEFEFVTSEGLVIQARLNLTDPTGWLLLTEHPYISSEFFQPVREPSLDRAFTFTMMPQAGSPGAPASKAAIVLVDKNVCTNGQMQTPFGTAIPFSATARDWSLTVVGVICDLQRTRTQHNAYTNQTSTQEYLAHSIIDFANEVYLYSPVGTPDGINGIGSLLYSHVREGEHWRIPNCNSSNPSAPWTVDDSDTWARAVKLVEYYESSLLAASIQFNQSAQYVDVMVSTIGYRLAILPFALLTFGIFLGILGVLLLYLLVFRAWIPRHYYPLTPLRIIDQVDRHSSSIARRLPAGRTDELTPEELETELGKKWIER